jgi:hypothetical protein
MARRKTPQRMTKKQFLKKVTRGALSADHVIGKMVDELQWYERKYGITLRGFLCADSRNPRGESPGLPPVGDLLS